MKHIKSVKIIIGEGRGESNLYRGGITDTDKSPKVILERNICLVISSEVVDDKAWWNIRKGSGEN